MADFGGMVLTTQGLNLLAKAQTGAALDITRVAAGAGVWADDTNAEDVTALVDERLSVPIQSMSVQGDGTVKLTVVISNSGLAAGFIFRELGVFAQDPDLGEILYAVAYSGDRYDYLPASTTTVEKILDIYIVVGGAQNVTATISPGAILALKEDITAHENADPAHPSTKIGFDNTTAVLAGEPDRAQSAIEALANELADAESGLAAHEAADPAHPASHISFDNSVAKLPGDPDRTQTAIEALNANLIAAPYATLDYPTVCTADNRAGVTGAAAAAGGIVSLPAGVTIVLGEDLGDGLGRMRAFSPAAWQSTDLDADSTYYLRGQVAADGTLLVYTAKGTDSDAIPDGLKGTVDATESGGFDSTVLDVLLAKVVTGAAGSAPAITLLANAAVLSASISRTSTVYSSTGNDPDTYQLSWARAPRRTSLSSYSVYTSSGHYCGLFSPSLTCNRHTATVYPFIQEYANSTAMPTNGYYKAQYKYNLES